MRRRMLVWLIVVAGLVTGCTLNAGTEFAAEYEKYLVTRDDVADYDVRGYNNLPGQGNADTRVDLRDGLTDDQIATAISEIARYRTDQKVNHHNLSVFVTTPNGSGAPARVSVFVRTGDEPVQDTDPAALRERVQLVRAYAVTDPGLIEMWASAGDLDARTSGDPYASADALVAYAQTRPPTVRRLSARSGHVGSLGVVSLDADGSVQALRPMRLILAALPPDVTPRRWRATSQEPVDAPQFELDLPAGTDPAVLAAVEQRAAALGVPLRAIIAR
ncbi:hypothetical protein MUG78_14260 [Gordonia alkaliphila]|uniref:hypothetical protein n=1 Tax=Gordonia alkaliphila TaxID=1053547 RepID=UPI001FF58424|nr:hypothetical protein [Gordonia alkaliphila]MCK0440583.1 hypothetical protein [Gordonia alkaliphila]